MTSSVDPDETARNVRVVSSGSPLFAEVSVLVCGDEMADQVIRDKQSRDIESRLYHRFFTCWRSPEISKQSEDTQEMPQSGSTAFFPRQQKNERWGTNNGKPLRSTYATTAHEQSRTATEEPAWNDQKQTYFGLKQLFSREISRDSGLKTR